MSAAPEHTLILRPRVQRADESLRPTRVEIDLAAIVHNHAVLAQHVAPASVLAVVKADAYGHGALPVARALQAGAEVPAFGVALAEEGLELRDAGITGPVLVLNGVIGGAHREVAERGLTPVLYDLGEAERFDRAVRAAAAGPVGVHLKVDTGMSRLGVPDRQLDAFLQRLGRFGGVRIDGVMTHLACADSDDAFTAEQLARFDRAVALVRRHGHTPRTLHAANSAAAFRHPSARYDLVRAGIALFGGDDLVDVPLRPTLRWRSEVIALRTLEVGDAVGYDATWRASRRSVVATVPVGYGDGYMRAHSNRAEVLVGGRRCPIAGNVSMDLTSVDVTDVPAVAVGDEVVLLGAQEGPHGQDELRAAELARAAGTLAYEVWCAVSRRVPRFYRS